MSIKEKKIYRFNSSVLKEPYEISTSLGWINIIHNYKVETMFGGYASKENRLSLTPEDAKNLIDVLLDAMADIRKENEE